MRAFHIIIGRKNTFGSWVLFYFAHTDSCELNPTIIILQNATSHTTSFLAFSLKVHLSTCISLPLWSKKLFVTRRFQIIWNIKLSKRNKENHVSHAHSTLHFKIIFALLLPHGVFCKQIKMPKINIIIENAFGDDCLHIRARSVSSSCPHVSRDDSICLRLDGLHIPPSCVSSLLQKLHRQPFSFLHFYFLLCTMLTFNPSRWFDRFYHTWALPLDQHSHSCCLHYSNVKSCHYLITYLIMHHHCSCIQFLWLQKHKKNLLPLLPISLFGTLLCRLD